MKLTPPERLRYNRHLILPEVGELGQIKLKQGSVLIVGAGGLGSPAALYLGAAGVGRIGLIDPDCVSISNLQRQILYSVDQVDRPKVGCAKEKLQSLNPEIEIETYESTLNAHNALELIQSYDVIIDGTDNFPARYLINDACVLAGKPNIYGAISRFDAQVSLISAPGGPCYRCLYPEPPSAGAIPNCNEAGVLGVLPGIVGTIQATEALKWILEIGTSLSGRLMIIDALSMEFSTLRLERKKDCAACGTNPSIRTLIESNPSCSMSLTPEDFIEKLRPGKTFQLLDVRSQEEYDGSHLEEAIHIPLVNLKSEVDKLNSQQEIVVYCESGIRSLKAIGILKTLGFNQVWQLEGGLRNFHCRK
ncbi:MAG: molybdopterin-synthase adenylyltransferase MoeB [Bdellovibrionia bacterium]